MPRASGQKRFRRALAVLPAMRARVDQREVQAAVSALPLFHELLGFRFRGVKLNPRIARISAKRNRIQK
jgi:hypothetical protein